jgi:uncharacterized protein
MMQAIRMTWLATLIALAASGFAGLAAAQEPFERSALTIVTLQGRYHFAVEMALTGEQRAQGLQGREQVPPGTGMLFDFGIVVPVTMWMLNTPVPLDMIFIANDGKVVRVAERTQPFSRDIISSGVPVRAVLEVAGGTAEQLRIDPGSRILHPLFAN